MNVGTAALPMPLRKPGAKAAAAAADAAMAGAVAEAPAKAATEKKTTEKAKRKHPVADEHPVAYVIDVGSSPAAAPRKRRSTAKA